jgi:hypothetical protein
MLTAIAPLGADARNVVTDANSGCWAVAAGAVLGDVAAIGLWETSTANVGTGDVVAVGTGAPELHATSRAADAIAPTNVPGQLRASGVDPCRSPIAKD